MENEILSPPFSTHTASPDLIPAPKVCKMANLVWVKRGARAVASTRVQTLQDLRASRRRTFRRLETRIRNRFGPPLYRTILAISQTFDCSNSPGGRGPTTFCRLLGGKSTHKRTARRRCSRLLPSEGTLMERSRALGVGNRSGACSLGRAWSPLLPCKGGRPPPAPVPRPLVPGIIFD
jgi:hypothetical protein